jgi:hypothetical protein
MKEMILLYAQYNAMVNRDLIELIGRELALPRCDSALVGRTVRRKSARASRV